MTAGFTPPPLVWETLGHLRTAAERFPGGAVDLTIGTPGDPPPPFVLHAMATSGTERGYPASVGSPALRQAASDWMQRRLGVSIDPAQVAATIGSKEFVAGLPQWLRLRTPERDTVLYPAISYPTYAMGAQLAGCRAVAVPALADGVMDLHAISADDASRALCLWVNSPGNPTGGLDDLAAAAAWGRAHDVPVFSDECYVEFTWSGPPRTILAHGHQGVVAVHSLSKRSNLAGARCGIYAGDPDLVAYLSQLRKHAGFMVPGPVQAGAVAAFGDDEHVDEQRQRYLGRIDRMLDALHTAGFTVSRPGGAFYLWVAAPGDDGRADGTQVTQWLAEQAGILATPGSAYGAAGRSFVRLALVVPDETVELASRRLEALASPTATVRGPVRAEGA